MPDTDQVLVARFREGDGNAFEELYRRHSPRLFGLSCRMLGDTHDAEDVLQEVFLTVHRKLGDFRGASTLGTWLYRLAMNRCLDHLRRRQSRRGHEATGAVDGLAMQVPTPPAAGRKLDLRLDLERAVAQLPEGSRAAFLLHDVEGLEHREVGEVLGISPGTSKSQLHRARQRLRELLVGAAGRVSEAPAAGGGS